MNHGPLVNAFTCFPGNVSGRFHLLIFPCEFHDERMLKGPQKMVGRQPTNYKPHKEFNNEDIENLVGNDGVCTHRGSPNRHHFPLGE